MVRTRIAPSPTGYPHIGTVYQALFNWAFAKKHGGSFCVRIEDTDRERFVPDAEEMIFRALDWFDLQEDESPRKGGSYGPYRQSERLAIYAKYAHELVDKGCAYYCTYTPEALEALRQERREKKLPPVVNDVLRTQHHSRQDLTEGSYVIRLRMPDREKIVVKDEIRGEIVFESDLIDDQVILKSDGYPTYHLAVVVDDHLMEVSHVLRGEEWINSAPKHVVLYRYLGWQEPKWFHTSLLRNPDKSKMSKRHSHTDVAWYKREGFLPDAILNHLALMAWSHPEGRELFDRAEFIQVFDFADLKAVGPAFDTHKLEWVNGEKIRTLSNETLQDHIHTYLGEYLPQEYAHVKSHPTRFGRSIPLVKERIKKLSEYWPLTGSYFIAPERYDVDLRPHHDILRATFDALSHLGTWSAQAIGEAMQVVCDKAKMKRSEYFMSVRVAVTGSKISPPLNETMEILGQDECLLRLDASTK